jgi:inosose dehydratase
MAIGIQPTGWTNDDFPEIGDDYPYQVILEQTKEAGFEGGSTGHNYPSHLPSLRHAMESRGLKIASTWAGTAFTTGVDAKAAFAAFQAQVTFLKDVGAQDVVVAELANAVNQVRTKSVLNDRDRPTLNEAQWFLLIELLDQAGKYAKDQGMQLSYHPHVGTCVMTVKETERLLDHTNPDYVGLCLDTAHLRYGGASPKELVGLARKYAGRITHVHLKNVRPAVLDAAKNYSFYQAIRSGIFTVPGDPDGEDSELVLDPVMELLKEVGYSRWMVIEAEQVPTKYDPSAPENLENPTPLKYARIARAYLRKHLDY